MSIILQSKHIINTLEELQSGGRKNSERVVLWLGIRNGENIEIQEVFVPEQYASQDHFKIPKEGMAVLMKYLRQTRYFIAAQVHSHPNLAFHSWVDDEWAIVRHEGALSLVLPYFGLKTEYSTFVSDTAVFQLTSNNKWEEVLSDSQSQHYIINQ